MQKFPQPLTLNKYAANAAKNNLELILQVKQFFFFNLGSLHSIIPLKCGTTSLFPYSNKNKLLLLQNTTHLVHTVSHTLFKETHTRTHTNKCSSVLSALR